MRHTSWFGGEASDLYMVRVALKYADTGEGFTATTETPEEANRLLQAWFARWVVESAEEVNALVLGMQAIVLD
jgi:hypothetical protein